MLLECTNNGCGQIVSRLLNDPRVDINKKYIKKIINLCF